jgi:hypothetical protein
LEIEIVLDDSPSLRGDIARMVAEERRRAVRHAARALRRYGEGTPETIARLEGARYTEDQVIGNWFPGDAPLPASGEREDPA